MTTRQPVVKGWQQTRLCRRSSPSYSQHSLRYSSATRGRSLGTIRLRSKSSTPTANCRDMLMPRHDAAILSDPRGQMEAFQRFVAIERELVALLDAKLQREETLLR
jgi:hypothetical protein